MTHIEAAAELAAASKQLAAALAALHTVGRIADAALKGSENGAHRAALQSCRRVAIDAIHQAKG